MKQNLLMQVKVWVSNFKLQEIDVFIVKVIKMIIFFIISITLVFLVRGIHLPFIQWLMSGLLLLFGAIVFLSLGTILTNFKDEKTAPVFSDILFLALAMLGGLWFPTSQFPEWLQMLSKLTPTYHFRELAVGYISNNEIPSKSILIMIIYAIIFISISLIISKNRKQDIA